MPIPPRLPLLEAAHRWLTSDDAHTPAAVRVREALTLLVENRYRGGAAAVKRVHHLRERLLEDDRPLSEVSERSLTDAAGSSEANQTVGHLAQDSAPPDQGRLLYQLTRALRPDRVVELGTNIGISAAYIATALHFNDAGHLTTLEASRLRLQLARSHLQELGLNRVDTVEGYFDDTLPALLESMEQVDLAFVDGNHRFDATLRYFELVSQHASANALLVFDDIRWSEEMWEAWTTIVLDPRAQLSIDLGRTGLIMSGE